MVTIKNSLGSLDMALFEAMVEKNIDCFVIKRLVINYLLDNSYFTLGSMCFHQMVEIPMGCYPAPFMANIFLCYCERK